MRQCIARLSDAEAFQLGLATPIVDYLAQRHQEVAAAELTIPLFNELAHIGRQAAMPADRNGFKPQWETFDSDDAAGVDVANSAYHELPPAAQRAYSGISGMLTSYLVKVVCKQHVLDEQTFLDGREAVYTVGCMAATVIPTVYMQLEKTRIGLSTKKSADVIARMMNFHRRNYSGLMKISFA